MRTQLVFVSARHSEIVGRAFLAAGVREWWIRYWDVGDGWMDGWMVDTRVQEWVPYVTDCSPPAYHNREPPNKNQQGTWWR